MKSATSVAAILMTLGVVLLAGCRSDSVPELGEIEADYVALAGMRAECRAVKARSASVGADMVLAATGDADGDLVDLQDSYRAAVAVSSEACGGYERERDRLDANFTEFARALDPRDRLLLAATHAQDYVERLYARGERSERLLPKRGAMPRIDPIGERDLASYLRCAADGDIACMRAHQQRVSTAAALLSARQARRMADVMVLAIEGTAAQLDEESKGRMLRLSAPLVLNLCDFSKVRNREGFCLSWLRRYREILLEPVKDDNPLSSEVCLFRNGTGELVCYPTGFSACMTLDKVLDSFSDLNGMLSEGECQYSEMLERSCFPEVGPVCQLSRCQLEDESGAPVEELVDAVVDEEAWSLNERLGICDSNKGRTNFGGGVLGRLPDTCLLDAIAERNNTGVRRCVASIFEKREERWQQHLYPTTPVVGDDRCALVEGGGFGDWVDSLFGDDDEEEKSDFEKRMDAKIHLNQILDQAKKDAIERILDPQFQADVQEIVDEQRGTSGSDLDFEAAAETVEGTTVGSYCKEFGENVEGDDTSVAGCEQVGAWFDSKDQSITVNEERTGGSEVTVEELANDLVHEALHKLLDKLDLEGTGDHEVMCKAWSQVGNSNACDEVEMGIQCDPEDLDCLDDCSPSAAALRDMLENCGPVDPFAGQDPLAPWIYPDPEAVAIPACLAQDEEESGAGVCAAIQCAEGEKPTPCLSGFTCCCIGEDDVLLPSGGQSCEQIIECPPPATLVSGNGYCECVGEGEIGPLGPDGSQPGPRPEG